MKLVISTQVSGHFNKTRNPTIEQIFSQETLLRNKQKLVPSPTQFVKNDSSDYNGNSYNVKKKGGAFIRLITR